MQWMIGLLMACSEPSVGPGGDDSGPDGDPPVEGCRELEDLNLASELPEPGAELHLSLVTGGCLDPDGGIDGYLRRVLRVAETDEVLCVDHHGFRSIGTADDCGDCDLAWLVDWDAGEDFGSRFCSEVWGYDPNGIDLSFQESIGIDADQPQLWIRQEGYDWETLTIDGGYTLDQTEDHVFLSGEEESMF